MSYAWAVYAHLLAVAAFLLVHGVVAGVSFALRRQRDAARVRALTELSFQAVGATHLAMLLVLATGLVLAWLGAWWGAGWLWASLGLFVATWAAMFRFGTKHYDRVRAGVGAREFYPRKGAPPPAPLPPADLDRVLASPRPYWLGALGTAVLAALLWMMLAKPF